MKHILLVFIGVVGFSQPKTDTFQINLLLNQWHLAAAQTNFAFYFDAMTDDAVFIGTDASENWNKSQFKAYAKPYFDKGKAWSFTSLQRNVYFNSDQKTAWFDELLSTQMKICRGSGVVVKTKSGWKIKHYVLSMTIPNELVNQVTLMKTDLEDKEIQLLKSN